MKNVRFLITLAILLLSTISIFSEEKEKVYEIKKINGKVQFENSLNKWQVVNEKTKLYSTTIISTGLNSSIVLMLEDGSLQTIKAMKKGVIGSLLSSDNSGGSGITIGAKVTESNISSETTQGRTNISTASTRASSAVEDIEWVEEEE